MSNSCLSLNNKNVSIRLLGNENKRTMIALNSKFEYSVILVQRGTCPVRSHSEKCLSDE